MAARIVRPHVAGGHALYERADGRRCKRGFTLVELLVALVLLDCALLALAGTLALLSREIAAATAKSRALTAAHARLAWLAASSCGPSRSGAQDGPPREWWTDHPTPARTRILVDSVEYQARGVTLALVLRTRALC
jgi:Tfp pilus assembly protein PilV